MACESLNQQTVSLNVSFGSLPEGFCPANMQDLGAAIAARLIITPNQGFSSFAIGSLEPSSNVGPWLKDCLEWFVFDETLARYVPENQSFNDFQVFDANGNFTVPDSVYRVRVEAWGAGGGGGSVTPAIGGGAGGGGGGYGLGVFAVAPSQNIAVAVGTGGAGGTAGGNTGSSGTASMFLTMIAGGGSGGLASAQPDGGAGGVVTGANISINGTFGDPGDNTFGSSAGGHGGSSPNGGGGSTSTILTPQKTGVTPGGGGAGGWATQVVGGNGANGRVIVWF